MTIVVILLMTSVFIILIRSKEIESDLIVRDKLSSEKLVPGLVNDIGTYYAFDFDVYSRIVKDLLKGDPNILNVRALSTNGEILFDGSELVNGKYDKSTARLVTDSYILKTIALKKTSHDFINYKGERVIRILTPYIDTYGVYRAMVEFYFSTSQIDKTTNQMIIYFMELFGVFLIFGVVITWMIAERITKPIYELTQGAREIVKGNFNSEVKVRSNDELGELAIVFNQMGLTISQNQKKIKDYYADLDKKIEERTKELNSKNSELNSLNSFMVGRELKMIELKKEVAELKKLKK